MYLKRLVFLSLSSPTTSETLSGKYDCGYAIYFLSNNRLSCDKVNYAYTLFRRKNTKIIPLQSIKIGLTWIIFSSFSRYIVNILVGEEHWRFHKGEVTAYAQNIWYFQKNICI